MRPLILGIMIFSLNAFAQMRPVPEAVRSLEVGSQVTFQQGIRLPLIKHRLEARNQSGAYFFWENERFDPNGSMRLVVERGAQCEVVRVGLEISLSSGQRARLVEFKCPNLFYDLKSDWMRVSHDYNSHPMEMEIVGLRASAKVRGPFNMYTFSAMRSSETSKLTLYVWDSMFFIFSPYTPLFTL